MSRTISTASPAPSPHPVPEPAPPMPSAIDPSGLLQSLGGDEALLAEFIEAMRLELPQRVARLHDAGLASDASQACAQAHALRGALGSVGAATAIALTRELENSAKTDAWKDFEQTLDRLKLELRGVEAALAALG